MKAFTILAAIFAVANAAPLVSDDAEALNSTLIERRDTDYLLEKRDTEILYLENCNPNGGQYSAMAYYPTSAAGNSGQAPAGNNLCRVSNSGYISWEGNGISCTFPSGVTFTSHIDLGAQSRANYAFAGTGNNGKNWNCYKDNKRTVYGTCSSIYYCLPA